VERATKRGEVRLGEAKETIGDARAGLGNIAGGTDDESVDRLEDEVIDRVEEMIIRAHRNPQYSSALRTMPEIIRKYATKLSLAASSVPETRQSGSNPRQTSKYSGSAVHRGHHSILLPLLGLLLFIYLWLHDSKMKTDIQ